MVGGNIIDLMTAVNRYCSCLVTNFYREVRSLMKFFGQKHVKIVVVK